MRISHARFLENHSKDRPTHPTRVYGVRNARAADRSALRRPGAPVLGFRRRRLSRQFRARALPPLRTGLGRHKREGSAPWRSAFRADRARPWEVCGPVLARALARLAFLLRSVVKSRLFLSLAWSQLIYTGRLDALHAPSQRFAQNPHQRRAVASTDHTPSCHI